MPIKDPASSFVDQHRRSEFHNTRENPSNRFMREMDSFHSHKKKGDDALPVDDYEMETARKAHSQEVEIYQAAQIALYTEGKRGIGANLDHQRVTDIARLSSAAGNAERVLEKVCREDERTAHIGNQIANALMAEALAAAWEQIDPNGNARSAIEEVVTAALIKQAKKDELMRR